MGGGRLGDPPVKDRSARSDVGMAAAATGRSAAESAAAGCVALMAEEGQTKGGRKGIALRCELVNATAVMRYCILRALEWHGSAIVGMRRLRQAKRGEAKREEQTALRLFDRSARGSKKAQHYQFHLTHSSTAAISAVCTSQRSCCCWRLEE